MALSQRIASLTVQPDVPATAKVAKRSARLAPISPISAVDRAADELRHAIVRGTLKPGKSIIIRELAADLGISHIPIREALRRLESEGFLTLRHAHSAVVTPMSREDLGDIYRVRVLLEPAVVARAAKRFTERDFELMDALVAALSVEMEVERSFELHQELHLALLRPGASSWELRILLALWAANERYLRAVVPCVVAGTAHDQGRHQRLLQVARSRDGKKLKLEMKRHLEAGRQVVVDHMFPGDPALSG